MTRSGIAGIVLSWFVGALPVLAQPEVRQPGLGNPRERGTLILEIADSFGEGKPLRRHYYVRIVEADGNRIVWKGWNRRVFRNLSYGYYLIWVRAAYRRPRHQLVLLNTPEQTVRVGLSFQPEEEYGFPGDYLKVRGRIRAPARVMTKLWVRVHGVLLRDSREARVDKHGRFEIGGLDAAVYVVEVFNGSRLIHAETLEMEIGKPVTELSIKLGQSSGEMERDGLEGM